MTETKRPVLLTNPADDLGFHDAAEAALVDGSTSLELQEFLRRDYPLATVRPRELSGEQLVVWYVYRDGQWVARHDHDQG